MLLGFFHARDTSITIIHRIFLTSPKLKISSRRKYSDFKNEPNLQYLISSKERDNLKKALIDTANATIKIPIVIGTKELYVDHEEPHYQVMPHSHKEQIAEFYHANVCHVREAIKIALKAKEKWYRTSIEEKYKIWMNAADIIAGPQRQNLNAAIMLGQGKTAIQAEIDVCELIDFLRYYAINLKCVQCLFQPLSPNNHIKNEYIYRPLDGFVASISPFNFAAIAGNLAYTPTLMGNVVLWKPSDTSILSNWLIFKILRECGVPPGVVNFLPSSADIFGTEITSSNELAAVNFTGSVASFQNLFQAVGNNINNYKTYPRLIGECGGKNYHFVHSSSPVPNGNLIPCTIRSAFEYSGQKCSACSCLYIPNSHWKRMKPKIITELMKLKMGPVSDFETFTSAVIDEKSFKRLQNIINSISCNNDAELIYGGKSDDNEGYFIETTIIECKNLNDKLFTDEFFGPILAVYPYEEKNMENVLNVINNSKYALTGSLFAEDKNFIDHFVNKMISSCGNMYINEKSTGSVVGQQPFGGAKISGTNDKAGSPFYLLRWASPITITTSLTKLAFDIDYPYMRNIKSST